MEIKKLVGKKITYRRMRGFRGYGEVVRVIDMENVEVDIPFRLEKGKVNVRDIIKIK